MAPSSRSEDVLDLDQVTLQEAPLPPPIQRVMDPGQHRMFSQKLRAVICASLILLYRAYFRFLRPRVSNDDP